MDLALARIRDNVGQLRGPIQRSAHEALSRTIAGRVKIAHLRYYLAAALSVALIGIGVNALLLQRERHPAPLFGSSAAEAPLRRSRRQPRLPLKSQSARKTTPRLRSSPRLFRRRGRPSRRRELALPTSDPIAESVGREKPTATARG